MPTAAAPRAIVESSPAAAHFYASLLAQRLVHGAPAARRFGKVLAFASRHGPPRRPFELALRTWPSRPSAAVDRVVERVLREWPRLAAAARALPAAPPDDISAIAFPRRVGLVVVLIDAASHPLLIAKEPGDLRALERERTALERVEALAIAPRWLGRVDGAYVQEGLRGEALGVQPLSPTTASGAAWTDELEQVTAALTQLAATTAGAGEAPWLENARRVAAEQSLPAAIRSSVAAALADIARDGRIVLEHGDPSPQNFLFDRGRLTGAIDWEFAVLDGLPGADVLDVVTGAFLHGVGLTTWSGEAVGRAFAAAWPGSELFTRGRAAAREAVLSAGVDEARAEAYELVYFAGRAGASTARTNLSALDVRAELRMLETVCGG